MAELYPWGGSFTEGRPTAPVAVVTLDEDWEFDPHNVAIWGKMKTENLGIEHVVANVISNPNIRYLIVAGREIRGHRAGDSILALYRNGVDENGRIKGAGGAVPYIENLDAEAIERWRSQVEMVDMVGVEERAKVVARIRELLARPKGPYGEPYIAIRKKRAAAASGALGAVSLHRSLTIDQFGEVRRPDKREE